MVKFASGALFIEWKATLFVHVGGDLVDMKIHDTSMIMVRGSAYDAGMSRSLSCSPHETLGQPTTSKDESKSGAIIKQ